MILVVYYVPVAFHKKNALVKDLVEKDNLKLFLFNTMIKGEENTFCGLVET